MKSVDAACLAAIGTGKASVEELLGGDEEPEPPAKKAKGAAASKKAGK